MTPEHERLAAALRRRRDDQAAVEAALGVALRAREGASARQVELADARLAAALGGRRISVLHLTRNPGSGKILV